MAAQYYLHHNGQETGPYGFRDLIAFVRDGMLVDSDLVRFSWTNQWQRADSLVGLFHMARKSPADVARHDASAALAVGVAPIEPDPPSEDVLSPEVDDRPGWMRRLLEVGGIRRKKAAEIPILGPSIGELRAAACSSVAESAPTSDLPVPPNAQPGCIPVQELIPELSVYSQQNDDTGSNAWSNAVGEALSAVEARRAGNHSSSRKGRFFGLFNRLSRFVPRGEERQDLMRTGFRLACAFVCANLVALTVENWSAQEALQFPSRETQQAALRHFPIFGTCSSGEYLFLLFDLMLAAGAAAWFAAGWLESHAE